MNFRGKLFILNQPRGKIHWMKQRSSDLELLSQSIADLEAIVREELIALQYEIIGVRDGLSDELAERCDEINQRLATLEQSHRDFFTQQ